MNPTYPQIVLSPSYAVTTVNGHAVHPATQSWTPETPDVAVLNNFTYGTALPTSKISYYPEYSNKRTPPFNGPVGTPQLSYGGIPPTGSDTFFCD